MNLQQRYTKLVHDYCEEFYRQMYPDREETYDPDYWVGGEVGGVILIDRCSMYLDFEIIRTVVDNKIPLEVLSLWFYESLEREPWPNLITYWKMVRSEKNLEKAHKLACEMYPEKREDVEDSIRKETIKEVIDLADKIEVKRTSIEDKDEWYGFKEFRNTMRDKLEELEIKP